MYASPQFTFWSGPNGCCSGPSDDLPPIDVANGYMVISGTRFSLSTGKAIAGIQGVTGFGTGYTYQALDGAVVYHASSDGQIQRGSFATQQWDWKVQIGGVNTVQIGNPVLAGGAVAAASPAGTVMALETSASQTIRWTKSFKAYASTNTPIITVATGPVANVTTKGLLLQGTGDPSLIAFDLKDGTNVWTWPAGGNVDDVVVGDGGLIYVLVSAEARVHVLSAATGKEVFLYTNVSSGAGVGAEILLRGGRVFVSFNGVVSSWLVPSAGYDSTSTWPTRFHDNQRTDCLSSPMTW